MKKNRQNFEFHFDIDIVCLDGKVIRSIVLDGKIIYQERFASSTAWACGGGNPVLDLFEKRFLYGPKKREDTCSYRCNISGNSKGIRRIFSKFLHLQIQFFNVLLKNFIFRRKSPNA